VSKTNSFFGPFLRDFFTGDFGLACIRLIEGGAAAGSGAGAATAGLKVAVEGRSKAGEFELARWLGGGLAWRLRAGVL
jgi:hypothetical protein